MFNIFFPAFGHHFHPGFWDGFHRWHQGWWN
jgi:hypothetical protein